LRTILYEQHLSLGARMTTFAGWSLPVYYPRGALQEHLAVRSGAGLFDIDHMGRIEISGADALPLLQRVLTRDISRLKSGQAAYSLMCYHDGGIVDDVFVYRFPDRYLMIVNAGNRSKDLDWLHYASSKQAVAIQDVSADTVMLALQGPKAENILARLTPAPVHKLLRNHWEHLTVAGVVCFVSRTGYTGEDGFELLCPKEQAIEIWNTLLSEGEPFGLVPAGLAARDSLRFEACFPLYGHELTASITPLEAGLEWAVTLSKPAFWGRSALIKAKLEGSARHLVGIEMLDRGVPRSGYRVLANDEPCGWVTSGMYAPTLDRFLALAYVTSDHARIGNTLQIEMRGRKRNGRIVSTPFYRPAYRRQHKKT